MKNAVIFHGSNCRPDMFWYPCLKRELTKRGYKAWLPELPQTQTPELKNWLPFALKNGSFDKETVLIGHSAGAALALSLLENIETQIRKTILVAGFCRNLTGRDEKILQSKYDWLKIRSHSKEFIFINSDDDPWGIDDKSGRELFNHLGGAQITLHGQGHMGSSKFNQLYPKFPLIIKLVQTDSVEG